MSDRVLIRKLPSGVPGLDHVLGGGIPELSFNLIAGGPGCGKTTLGNQILFANATSERKAIYFTIIGEPPVKMLRYQQQYSFFDTEKLGDAIRFVHLGDEANRGGLKAVLKRIQEEVDNTGPSFVAVDSFRSMFRRRGPEGQSEHESQDFVQELALHLTNAEATTFLLGEFDEAESDNAVFTVADGLIWLAQAIDRNSIVRKVNVMKMRGQGQIPGLHTARITEHGLDVFPRLLKPESRPAAPSAEPPERLSTGVHELDAMMGGGVPQGYSVVVAGPSGSGKTVLAHQFLLDGAKRGEMGIIAVFEKRPDTYLETTPFGPEFKQMVAEGKIQILYVRPLDLSIDETLFALREAVVRVGAKRAVIDSLSGLELALAPTFREDFRESLYRMMGALTESGVTVVSTVELEDDFTRLKFSPQGIAFLSDALVIQRYVEIRGELRRVMSVVKVRSSPHSADLREYHVTAKGLAVKAERFTAYDGLLTGAPREHESPDDLTGTAEPRT